MITVIPGHDDDSAFEEAIHIVQQRLDTSNDRLTRLHPWRHLAFFMYDERHLLIGGLSGWTWGNCLSIDYLWIDEAWRGYGYGQRLMREAETEAKERGCTLARLETHTFQAPSFYEKLGYLPYGILENFPEGYQLIALWKDLTTE